MGEQLDIFGPGTLQTESMRSEDARARAAAKKRPSIDQRWAEFHRDNPHVLTEMLRLTRARLERGDTRIGVKALWEELRASLAQTAQRREVPYADFEIPHDYKLNNDFTAIYARKLIELEPRLDGVIELRARKAKK